MNVSVMTFNCHLGVTARRYEEDKRREAIISYIKNSNIDVVCLCEVWKDKENKIQIMDDLDKEYPYHFFDNTSPYSLAHGLLVLSKYPIFNNHVKEFECASGGWDWFANKAFLNFAVLLRDSTNQTCFSITHTHTQAADKKTHEDIREKQFNEIVKFINENNMDEKNNLQKMLITGDLNVIGGSSEYSKLCGIFNGFIDTYPKINNTSLEDGYTYSPDNIYCKHWNDDAKNERLDYIWSNMEIEKTDAIKVATDVVQSDHYPLVAHQLTVPENQNITMENVFKDSKDIDPYLDGINKEKDNTRSARIKVINSSRKKIIYGGDHIYDGGFYVNPPAVVPAGYYGGGLCANPDGQPAQGCESLIYYKVDGNDNRGFVIGMQVKIGRKNKSFVQCIAQEEWQNNKSSFVEKLRDGKYEDESTDGELGIKVTTKIGKGHQPYLAVCVSNY